MKVGAYQFAATGDISDNLNTIKSAIIDASEKGIRLLVFPECALTGYPPHDMASSSAVDFGALDMAYQELQALIDQGNVCLILGTISKEHAKHYNSALILRPKQAKLFYHKRALWGWDRENFTEGKEDGIFDLGDWKIGVRICFEVRFPEFFRELYRQKTDLNIVLFYDVSSTDDAERYDLIKAHLRTRAMENTTPILSVNTICPYQTAPTALCDQSGHTLAEACRNTEGLLVFELEKTEPNFGEQGRIELSDRLTCSAQHNDL